MRRRLTEWTPTARVRNLIRIGLRPVPTSLLTTAARRDDKTGKLAGQGLRGRRATIAEGPGAGLVIDVGGSNPGYAVGTNELPVQHALAALLSPGDTCFDVGANVGFFTLIAARLVGPRGRVVAFEPGPDNLPVLRQNLADNAATQVTVSETAVSNTDGHGRLLLAEYSGGHSLAPQATEARGTMPVETVTLDTFVRNHDTGAPDVVKIDVEGAEPAVLEGMATLLDEHHPALILEIDAASQSEHDDQLERIRSLLDVHHYGMRPLEPSYFAGWVVSHWVCESTSGEERR